MNREKLDAVLQAAQGLTYAEWRLVAERIERTYQQQLNRMALSDDDVAKVSAAMHAELAAYFDE